MSLVERGELELETTARSVLGDDLPLVDDRVTVEHLLAHRSGIGDYLDEDEVDDWNGYVHDRSGSGAGDHRAVPKVLDGHPMKFEPGERFVYCNGGYVVLALIAERACGVPFHDLVEQRVCVPAGMIDTAFLRSDELPGRAALGYLEDEGLRTNVFHLPVRGNGDGGIYTTARGCPRALGRTVRRSDRDSRHRRRDGAPAQRCAGELAALRARLLALRHRPAQCRSTASMRASGSSRSAIPVDGSPTPSSTTRAEERGRQSTPRRAGRRVDVTIILTARFVSIGVPITCMQIDNTRGVREADQSGAPAPQSPIYRRAR